MRKPQKQITGRYIEIVCVDGRYQAIQLEQSSRRMGTLTAGPISDYPLIEPRPHARLTALPQESYTKLSDAKPSDTKPSDTKPSDTALNDTTECELEGTHTGQSITANPAGSPLLAALDEVSLKMSRRRSGSSADGKPRLLVRDKQGRSTRWQFRLAQEGVITALLCLAFLSGYLGTQEEEVAATAVPASAAAGAQHTEESTSLQNFYERGPGGESTAPQGAPPPTAVSDKKVEVALAQPAPSSAPEVIPYTVFSEQVDDEDEEEEDVPLDSTAASDGVVTYSPHGYIPQAQPVELE